MSLIGEIQYLQIGDNTYQIKDKALEQVAATASSYTYWRPLLIGASSSSSEGFTPSTVTDKSYTFPNIAVQPSTGSIRINKLLLVNGSYKTTFSPATLAANRTITIPDKTGTLALTSDVPVASSDTPQELGTAAAGSSTDYSRADHVHTKPTYSASDVGLGNVDNVQQYSVSNPPPYPVTSVNSQTGAVSLSIPSKTSDLTNDSGYITGMYIASYGSSTYADVLAAYQANKVVYCRASSNSNPGTGSQLRMAFLAYVNNQTTPTEFEFQYYRSVSTHSDSQQGDQVYVYKLNSSGTWSVTTREAYTKVSAGTNMTSSYSSGVITLNATMPTVPSAATATPLVDGTAAVGSSTKYALEDHVHPTDTSRAAAGLGISSASAGQVVKISTVDSSGVPTAYTSGTVNSGMVITLTLSGSTYTADKTYDEISAALSSGTDCCVVYNSMQYPFISRRSTSSSFYFDFCKIDASSYGVTKDGFTISKDGNNTRVQNYYSSASIPSIPDPLAPSTILELVQNDDDPPSWVINGSPIQDMEFCFYGEGTWTPITILRKHVVDFDGTYPPTNGDTENYYLSKLYTTYEPPIDDYGDYIITGYLVFQAIINENGIKKIKTITVSEEFYQYDDLANATITFSEEVVNITHQCYADTLSSAGWYRIMTFANDNSTYDQGATGIEVDFHIGRRRTNAREEIHNIKMLCLYDSVKFVDETSAVFDTSYFRIDKIRYTYSSTNGYVDVHIIAECPRIRADFEVHCEPYFSSYFTSNNFTAVADSPSGETVLTTHNFQSNNALWQSATITPTLFNLAGSITLNGNTIWYKSDKSVLQFSTIATIDITSRTGANGGFKFNLPFAYNGPTNNVVVGTQSKFSNEFVYIAVTNGSSEVIVKTTETNSNITTGTVRYLISQVTLFMN